MVKLLPLSKLCWDYAGNLKFGTYSYRHTCIVSENNTFFQSNNVRYVKDVFLLFSKCFRLKFVVNKNYELQTYIWKPANGLLQIWYKSEKMMIIIIYRHVANVKPS